MNNQLLFLISTLANRNNIKIDKKEAKLQLLSHPYYPSLNCITDLFNHFNIDNLALSVETNLETFNQIPNVFMAQIKDDKDIYLAVASKKEGKIELIYGERKSKIVSVDKFLDLWSGVLIVIEKSENKDNNSQGNLSRIKSTLYIATTLFLASLFLLAKPSVFQILHFTLCCFGLYISYLIIQQELGLYSKILDKFCSGRSKKTDCDAVLDSKGATILGLFKLSDVGLVYFGCLILSWLIIALNGFHITSAIVLISLLVIPFTVYSIYYQWFVVKSWCPLCLTIVGVLWAQFAVSIFMIDWGNLYAINISYIYVAESLLAVLSIWIIIYPLLIKKQQFEKLEIEHIKFKRNFKLFEAVLKLNPQLNTKISFSKELVFGSKNGSQLLEIMVVTNPMCGFCKESHQLVEKILNKEYSDVQIIIRFNVRVDDVNSNGTKIAIKILELYHTTNEKKCLNALSDIYSKMSAEDWLSKWGEATSNEYIAILKDEKEWCGNNKINFTPAILINGYQYPSQGYDKMDLLFFMEELIEE